MKKILLLPIFFMMFFSEKTWAQNSKDSKDSKDSNTQGILTDVVDSDPKQFLLNIEPKITGRLIVETQLDNFYHTTNRQDEYKDLRGKVRLYSNLHLNKQVWINSYIAIERLDNSGTVRDGTNRYFENTGAYFQELNLHTDHENYLLVAGKFNLNFGNGWKWDRGLWSYNIAESYKLIEKLGFSGVYRIGDAKKTGQYNFTLSTFTNDRKNLDNSVLVHRDSARKSNGLPGDTRSLSSYNASLNVNFDFGNEEKLTYNFSYIKLDVNRRASPVADSKIADQKGFVVGMNYKYPWKENIAFDLLLEYAEMKNFGGNSDISEKYFTGNLITRFNKNWNVLVGHSNLERTITRQNGFNKSLDEISLGYDFNKTAIFDRLTVQGGLRRMYTNNQFSPKTQNALGILVRYYKYF